MSKRITLKLGDMVCLASHELFFRSNENISLCDIGMIEQILTVSNEYQAKINSFQINSEYIAIDPSEIFEINEYTFSPPSIKEYKSSLLYYNFPQIRVNWIHKSTNRKYTLTEKQSPFVLRTIV